MKQAVVIIQNLENIEFPQFYEDNSFASQIIYE